MKIWKLAILGTVVTAAGAAVFLGSRKAAAAEASTKGFKVSADCKSIEIVNEGEAQAAVTAAALASFRDMDEPASDLLDRALDIMFAKCAPLGGDTQVKAKNYPAVSLAVVRTALAGQSVGDVADAAKSGNFELVGAAGEALGNSVQGLLNQGVFGGLR